MAAQPAANLHVWTAHKLSASLTRKLERIATSTSVVRVAVMPDVHDGPPVPNGCVIATQELIYPEAVGKDIGCGISAIQFAIAADDIPRRSLETILQGLKVTVPTLKQPCKSRAVSELPEACHEHALSNLSLAKLAKREGKLQLGTLGRGNHFVELQRDAAGLLWAMVHSGSRGMGEAITSFHLHQAERLSTSDLAFLDLSRDSGQAYYSDMLWATKYAAENRLLILNRLIDLVEQELTVDILPQSFIDCPHNFARLENHFGQQLIVHRKSANSARSGELGIVPGSMATGSRIVSGRGQADALHSSAHGAGRSLSRREATESISVRSLAGMMRGITFLSDHVEDLRDEAPEAYKNLSEVMRAQSDLVRTENTLSTILNFKGL